jgi:ribosome production factor 1
VDPVPASVMAYSKAPAAPMGIKPKNKLRRQAAYQSIRKAKEVAKRDERFARKREEAKDPSQREERLARNKPATIDNKRVWDTAGGDEEDALGWAVDVERLAKKRKLEEKAAENDGESEESLMAKIKQRDEAEGEDNKAEEEQDDEVDSMVDFDSEDEDEDGSDSDAAPSKRKKPQPPIRETSPPGSTATNLDLSPEFLKQKFPALFAPAPEPKVLVTTSINSTLHDEARILTDLFPVSVQCSLLPICKGVVTQANDVNRTQHTSDAPHTHMHTSTPSVK